MTTVKIYTKEGCHLCEEAKKTLLALQRELPFKLEDVDITSDKDIYEEFKEKIPAVFIDEKIAFKYRVEERELRRKLQRFLRSKGII